MHAPQGRASLRWAFEIDGNGTALHLAIYPDDPRVLDDEKALASIEAARLMTERRAGGWHLTRDGPRSLLPWHPDFTPEDHSWMWLKLLQAYATRPDLSAPGAQSWRYRTRRDM